jgi:oligosaccharyl transferase complex subunit OST4
MVAICTLLTNCPVSCVRSVPSRETHNLGKMISDDELYRLAIFLGSAAMVLIVVYHYFEVNSGEAEKVSEKAPLKAPLKAPPGPKPTPSK